VQDRHEKEAKGAAQMCREHSALADREGVDEASAWEPVCPGQAGRW